MTSRIFTVFLLLATILALGTSGGNEEAESIRLLGHSVESPTSWYNVWFASPEPPQRLFLRPSRGPEFGYTRYNGPDTWSLESPDCAGSRQSPINLDSNVMLNLQVPTPLTWEGYWQQPVNLTLTNTGHTVRLTGNWPFGESPTISGGPLDDEYVFSQLHFHWGRTDRQGSEHTVHNVSFPMEMHAVHYKRKYGSEEEATRYRDGLVVASYLFQVSRTPNFALEPIVEALEAIPGTELRVNLIPGPLAALGLEFDSDYVVYEGSLTTPPCSEAVTWMINAHPLTVSHFQLQRLRSLPGQDGMVTHNFRPVQPLNGRPVYYVS